jgi:hypothetical protein
MADLSISADTSGIASLIDGKMNARLHKSLALGVRNSLATIQKVHKTEVIGRGIGPWGDVWTTRTGSAARSFHIEHTAGSTEGAYGSELERMAVLELGTQVALGGPLRPRNGKYLAIPTKKAKVGRGASMWPRDYPEGALTFITSKAGNPLLVRMKTGKRGGFDVMFVLRRQVTIKPHPTLPRTQERAQPAIDAQMLAAVDAGLAAGGAK